MGFEVFFELEFEKGLFKAQRKERKIINKFSEKLQNYSEEEMKGPFSWDKLYQNWLRQKRVSKTKRLIFLILEKKILFVALINKKNQQATINIIKKNEEPYFKLIKKL